MSNPSAPLPDPDSRLPWYVPAGLALACGAGVLLQLLLTRLFSITLAYHFAFVVVSLVMLSLAAPGALLAAFPSMFRVRRPEWAAGWFSLTFGLLLLAVLALYLAFPFRVGTPDLDRLFGPGGARNLLAVFTLWGGLFILGGFAPALVLTRYPQHSARLYGWDLVGAGLGGAIFLPLLALVSGVTGFFVTAALLCAAAALFWWPHRPLRLLAGCLLVVISLAGWLNATQWPNSPVRIRYAKFYDEPSPMIEKWSPTSRITVFDKLGDPFPIFEDRPFGWAMSRRKPDDLPRPKEYWMEQDASAGTPITAWDGRSTESVSHILYDVTSLAVRTTAPGEMLVIGSGGGRDVLAGLLGGASKVTAVEMNPATAHIVQNVLSSFNGNLFNHPLVEFIRDEGRNWLRSNPNRKFDLVMLSLVDSMASTAAGGLVFVENFLYTQQAFGLYFDRLKPNGRVTLSYFWFGEPPATAYRLLATLGAVLRERGINEPHRHLQMVRNEITGTTDVAGVTFIMHRQPITEIEAQTLRKESAALDFQVLLDGWSAPENKDLADLMVNPQAVTDRYPFSFNPATDDNPFWLYISKPGVDYSKTYGRNRALLIASLMMTPLFFLLLAGVIVFVLVPLFIAWLYGGSSSNENQKTSGGIQALVGVGLTCLGCGLGYMGLELALMHAAVQLLGYPAYAVTIVLVGMLVGSGLGSLAAGFLSTERSLVAGRWAALIAILSGVGLAFLLPYKVDLIATLPWVPRAILMILGCLAIGAVLGVPFPSLLRWVSSRGIGGNQGHGTSAWAWCLNGAAGTLSGVAVMLLALRAGYSSVFLAVALCYGVALVGLLLCRRSPASHSPISAAP